MTEEYSERIFGSSECAILYLNPDLMKAAKIKPGDKLRITPDKDGFRVQLDIPKPGGQP